MRMFFSRGLFMKFTLAFFVRFVALTAWHFLSLTIAALVVGSFISLADQPQAPVNFTALISVGVLETAVIVWMLSRLQLWGVPLLFVSILVFHGVKTFLMMIELVFFLNIWASPPVISVERVLALELLGLLMACLYCPMVILFLKKWRTPNVYPQQNFPTFSRWLLLKIIAVSVLYTACYWMVGIYLLIPLAGESFGFTYGHLHVPMWMPLLQMARGLLWAFIVLLLVTYLPERGARLYLSIGLILAILGSVQLLSPNPYMLDHLRYAHIVEIWVSMMIFGGLAAWILQRKPVAIAD
jgi:hypothetical protein